MGKPIKKSGWEDEFFIPDIDLLVLWTFARQEFLPEKNYFGMAELVPVGNYSFEKYLSLLHERTLLDNRFDIGIYSDGGLLPELPPAPEGLKKFGKVMQDKIQKASKKIIENQFLIEDVLYVNKYTGEACASFYFMLKENVSQNDSDLRELLDSYIGKFLKGELLVTKQNYYNFEKQKELLIRSIRQIRAFEDFGKNFIVSSKYHSSIIAGNSERSVLFFHTLHALEYLGYIKVLKIWFEKPVSDYVFFANIAPNDSFKEEVYQDFRKENPKTIIEKFDEKTGILKFAGKNIALSKGKTQTDAVLLMKTLMKSSDDEWMHNDEILEDWGYREEEQGKLAKNKVYSSGKKVNTTVALQAGIDDLLEVTTSKIRINPKYKKIDE